MAESAEMQAQQMAHERAASDRKRKHFASQSTGKTRKFAKGR